MNNTIDQLVIRLRELSPFHARALRDITVVENVLKSPNGEEGYGRVSFDPSDQRFRIELTPRLLGMHIDTGVFILMHEIEHVLRGHLVYPRHYHPFKWNVACDACINDDLIDDYFTHMELEKDIVNAVVTHAKLEIDEDFNTAEEVYRQLPGDDEDMEDIVDPNTIGSSDLNSTPEGTADAEDMEEALEDLIREVCDSDDPTGSDVPKRFQKLHAPKHHKKFNYKSLLQEAFGRVRPMPTPTNSKINMRKYASTGLIGPGTRLKQIPRIFIGCDTSGSVVGYVPWFLVEIGNCIHDLEAEVDLHFTEAFDKGWIKKIDKIDKSNLKDIMKVAGYTAAGGGGTEFRRVYKDLIELNPRYDLIILFTDCYTDPPRERLHAPSGRTVVLNVGNPKTSWKYCEIYNVEVPSSENINPYG